MLLTVICLSGKSQSVFPSYSDSATCNVLECIWATNCITENYYFDYDTSMCGKIYSKMTFTASEIGYFKINGKNKFSLVFADNLNPGIYLLKVQTDKKVLLKRLVKT